MGIFEEMENDFKKFCDTSKKFIAEYKKKQKELELLRKMTDLLQEENLDYMYNLTDIAYDQATEMARDWEEQYKYEIAVLEKALELACLSMNDKCFYCKYKDDECPPEYSCSDLVMEYFKEQAKEMMESE